ncbi:hypothetical protein BDR22DRAFT_892380 [Usnea florida]
MHAPSISPAPSLNFIDSLMEKLPSDPNIPIRPRSTAPKPDNYRPTNFNPRHPSTATQSLPNASVASPNLLPEALLVSADDDVLPLPLPLPLPSFSLGWVPALAGGQPGEGV